MPAEQRLTPTHRALAHLLAGWLMALLFVQALAAAGAVIIGPLHRHLPSLLASVTSAASMASAASVRADRRAALDHPAGREQGHAHESAQRHQHGPADGLTLPPTPAETTGDQAAAQAVLAAMLALLTIGGAAHWRDTLRHVWASARLWPLLAWHPAPARRPPRT